MQSTSDRAAEDLLADLEAAADGLADAEAAVAEVGEEDARRVAGALSEARELLVSYEESATGTGDFRAYLEFQEAVATFVETLDDDLAEREAFEACESAVDGRRLSGSDFEAAREALAPAAEVAGRLDDRTDALERYRGARRSVRRRLSTVEDELSERRRVAALGDTDLDAPVEALRDPIEAYDEAVTEAFEAYKRDAPAREVLALAASASERALVDLPAPDDELLAFVRRAEVGTEPVTRLLEYADYSRSKLDHYVDDPAAIKRVVATRRTYLDRLSAAPLTVGWPPPPPATLRRQADADESVVRQFADEETVALCREVRRATRREDYGDLRRAALARDELTAEQRRLVRDGTLADEIDALEAERDRLAAALEEYPER
jgi:hypothetical protein